MWTFDVKVPFMDSECTQPMNGGGWTYMDKRLTKAFGECTTNVFGHFVYFACKEDDVVVEYSWMDNDACDPDNFEQAPVKLTFKNNQCVHEELGFSHYSSWTGACSSSKYITRPLGVSINYVLRGEVKNL